MKKLKYVKTFESFQVNEEIAGLAGGIAIGALFAYLSNFVPRLSNNPIKSISRFVKMSRVIKKYKPLIEELDVMFKNDPKINQFYKDIKTIGHGTSNQTTPATYAGMLKHYILHRVPTSMRPKVEDLMRELEKEVKEVGYDVYGEDSYSFESFQVNEEISLRGLAPIITSLFLTFNSFDASAYGGGRRYRAYATEEVHKISDKIERDLQRLKSETRDPELLRLIESVNTLDGWQASDGMEQVSKVVEDLKNYIESQEINEPLVNDTLKNLTTGDIEVIESDYQMLLQKYEEIDDHFDNMKLIMAIVCTLVAALWVYIGLKFKKII